MLASYRDKAKKAGIVLEEPDFWLGQRHPYDIEMEMLRHNK